MNANGTIRMQVEALLREADFKPVKRGTVIYWRMPGERGIIYDTAEAVMRLRDRNRLKINRLMK